MTHANLISLYRAQVQALLAANDALRALELVFTSEGGAAALFVSGDFTGTNADLTPTTFTNAVNSRAAIEATLSANSNANYTNLNLLRP